MVHSYHEARASGQEGTFSFDDQQCLLVSTYLVQFMFTHVNEVFPNEHVKYNLCIRAKFPSDGKRHITIEG